MGIMMWTSSLVVLGLLVNFIHMKHYLIETENMEGNSGADYTYKGKTKGYETKGYIRKKMMDIKQQKDITQDIRKQQKKMDMAMQKQQKDMTQDIRKQQKKMDMDIKQQKDMTQDIRKQQKKMDIKEQKDM